MTEEDDNADDVVHDPLTLSYIAVMCCGLAGALVLFLVFAAMPHVGIASVIGHAQRLAAGRDKVLHPVGARATEDSRIGIEDTLSIKLDIAVDLPVNAVEWNGISDLNQIAEAWAAKYDADPTRHVLFFAPVSVQKYQAQIITFNVRLPSTSKVPAVLVIMAGGESVRFEIEISQNATGSIDLNDPGGEAQWLSDRVGSGIRITKRPTTRNAI